MRAKMHLCRRSRFTDPVKDFIAEQICLRDERLIPRDGMIFDLRKPSKDRLCLTVKGDKAG